MKAIRAVLVVVVGSAVLLGGSCHCGRPDPKVDDEDGGTGPSLPPPGSDAGQGGEDGGLGGNPDGGADGGVGSPCTTDRSCFEGPPAAAGIGTCRQGVAFCKDGILGPCTGQVLPTPESCNGVDDDCDGVTDNPSTLGTLTCGLGQCRQTVAACDGGAPVTCVEAAPATETCDGVDNDCNGVIDEKDCGCIYVAPTGDDQNPGTPTSPKRTLSAAILTADSQDGGTKRVCAAAGAGCALYDYNEAVVMRNGVSVYGGYAVSGPSWFYTPGCLTQISAVDEKGVVFDSTISQPTILANFRIVGGNQATNAAVTIDGAAGAVLAQNDIVGGGGQVSRGVHILDAGPSGPTITSKVSGGSGTRLSIAIHSRNSAPRIVGPCRAQGHCMTACMTPWVHAPDGPTQAAYGILLEDSPGALVEYTSVCATQASSDVVGIKVLGDATGTQIRRNHVDAEQGAVNSVGVWFEDCNGASPWVLRNWSLRGASDALGATAEAVRAIGDCHPRIDSNDKITSGPDDGPAAVSGIRCDRSPDGGLSSQCSIRLNTRVEGPTAIRCGDGACSRIENNPDILGIGPTPVGLHVDSTGVFVGANAISARPSCGAPRAVVSNNSFARLENNSLFAESYCIFTPPNATIEGIRVFIDGGVNEVDVHSNNVSALGGGAQLCEARAVTYDVVWGSTPTVGRGLFRNNILVAERCTAQYAVNELSPLADPRVFQNNDLWKGVDGGLAVYRDEASSSPKSIQGVNALTDSAASGNISERPANVAGVLASNSACVNAGTDAGAPPRDFQGDIRPSGGRFDIGMDEYVQ